jgi:hypothetical protein
MASYQIYPLGSDGKIVAPSIDRECKDDAGALLVAKEIATAACVTVEVWQQGWLIGQVSADDP